MGYFLWLYSQRKGAWNWPRNLQNRARRNANEATIFMSCLNVVNYWLKLNTWLQSLLQRNVFDEKRQAGGELPQLLLLTPLGGLEKELECLCKPLHFLLLVLVHHVLLVPLSPIIKGNKSFILDAKSYTKYNKGWRVGFTSVVDKYRSSASWYCWSNWFWTKKLKVVFVEIQRDAWAWKACKF